MTVAELIVALQAMPQDAVVTVLPIQTLSPGDFLEITSAMRRRVTEISPLEWRTCTLACGGRGLTTAVVLS